MWRILKADVTYRWFLYLFSLGIHVLLVTQTRATAGDLPVLVVYKLIACMIAGATLFAIGEGYCGEDAKQKGAKENRSRVRALLPIPVRRLAIARLLTGPVLVWLTMVLFWVGYLVLVRPLSESGAQWVLLSWSGVFLCLYISASALSDLGSSLGRLRKILLHAGTVALVLTLLAVWAVYNAHTRLHFSPAEALAFSLLALVSACLRVVTFSRRKSYLG